MVSKKMTIDEAIADVTNKRDKAMEEILLMVEADAKILSPVDTGTLRRSITHSQSETKDSVVGVVGSNVEYAYFAELHKPYLEPAVDQNIENIKRKISEVMKE